MMPSVPTMIESGYPDFLAGSWFGVMAPAGTPPDIVRVLSQKPAEVASSNCHTTPGGSLATRWEA